MILGMDIGYSNLKLVYGDPKSPEKKTACILPAGAGPVEKVNKTIMGEVPSDVLQVKVGDELWAAGVAHNRLDNTVRQLHEDYPTSPAYQALFHASLLQANTPVIDLLITGLPVSQYYDRKYRLALQERLTGRHEVAPDTTVDVKRVIIMPQPVGGYLHFLDTVTHAQQSADGVLAIVDPGFFSFDWTIFEHGDLLEHRGGTDLSAVSCVFEEAEKMIKQAHNVRGAVSMSRLETNIREGRDKLFIGKKRISTAKLINEAANKVADGAFSALKLSVRLHGGGLNMIHLVGGGAVMYEDAARLHFPDCSISVDSEPVLANALGYFSYGAIHDAKKQ